MAGHNCENSITSLPDVDAQQDGYLRVLDESGEDYLYPESYFILVQLPDEVQEAL